jgi:hypothetical protein
MMPYSASTTGKTPEKVKMSYRSGSQKYGLTLHPEKTRLLEFERYAEERAEAAGQEETRHLQLPWLDAHLRTQPEREVHSARTMRKRLRRSLTAVAQ